MITELTKAQLDKFPQYIAEWTAKGLTTERRNASDAVIDFTAFQKEILKRGQTVEGKKNPDPAPVVILDSPSDCWKAVLIVEAAYAKDSKLTDYKRVLKLVNEQLKAQGAKAIKLPDASTLPTESAKFIWPYFDCQFWVSWFAFYEFFRVEVGIVYPPEYEKFKACQPYGMVFPLENLCIVCQPPTVIKKNASGLHCENGVALSYGGQNDIYALNGVTMTKEYVMTPAEQIDPKTIFAETNVEVRRELIRKVGMEHLLEHIPHKLLEVKGNYELYSIELNKETVPDARYLKMKNPSIGVWHLEAVGPEVDTIEKALQWRNQNKFTHAEILT